MNAPEKAAMTTPFMTLASINVNEFTEKKGNLTYLSWAWAVDQLLRRDHLANWEYLEPIKFADTMMVRCAVTAFGKTMTAQLPVMDHKNRPIPEPNAFEVNTAMQRCLAKGIALHGLGLYIYAGEDLPEGESEPGVTVEQIQQAIEALTLAAKGGKKSFDAAVAQIPAKIKEQINPQIKKDLVAKAVAVDKKDPE